MAVWRRQSSGLKLQQKTGSGCQAVLSSDIVKGFLSPASLSSLGLRDESNMLDVCVRESVCVCVCVRERVCVCVCVCVRERFGGGRV